MLSTFKITLPTTIVTTLLSRPKVTTQKKSLKSMKESLRTDVVITTIRIFILLRSTLIKRKLRPTDMPLSRPRSRLINKRNTSRNNDTTLDARDLDMSTTPRPILKR